MSGLVGASAAQSDGTISGEKSNDGKCNKMVTSVLFAVTCYNLSVEKGRLGGGFPVDVMFERV